MSAFTAALPATHFWRSKIAICKVFIRQVWTLKKRTKQGTATALSLFSPQHLGPGAVPPTSQLTGKCVWEGVWAPECDLNTECQIRLSFSVYLYISSRNLQTGSDSVSEAADFLNGSHSRAFEMFSALISAVWPDDKNVLSVHPLFLSTTRISHSPLLLVMNEPKASDVQCFMIKCIIICARSSESICSYKSASLTLLIWASSVWEQDD